MGQPTRWTSHDECSFTQLSTLGASSRIGVIILTLSLRARVVTRLGIRWIPGMVPIDLPDQRTNSRVEIVHGARQLRTKLSVLALQAINLALHRALEALSLGDTRSSHDPLPPPPPPLVGRDGEERWIVEALVGHRQTNRTRQYLVHWLGFPKEFDSWEPRHVLLEDVPDLVEDYEAAHSLAE